MEKGHAWYAELNPIVADTFLAEVDRAMSVILGAPERWPRQYGNIRHYVLHDFPYSVFYLARADVVHVIAVAPHKRKPHYWKFRKQI